MWGARICIYSLSLACAVTGCGPGSRGVGDDGPIATADSPTGPVCGPPCSADLTQTLDCNGNVTATCGAEELCGAGTCMPACDAAHTNKSSVGCDYYATAMAAYGGGFGGCFVSFVANTWHSPVHLTATWGTTSIDLGAHARIPHGSGPGVTPSLCRSPSVSPRGAPASGAMVVRAPRPKPAAGVTHGSLPIPGVHDGPPERRWFEHLDRCG